MSKIKVFYSGTWDLFHYGHLKAIEAAATLGDWLTVGVITDDFVRADKRKPQIPYEQRAAIVAALRCVNEVVPHRAWEDNVYRMILKSFDVRAVGPEHGEQHPVQRESRHYLEAAGVKYVVIPRPLPGTSNISTTFIKERIRNEQK